MYPIQTRLIMPQPTICGNTFRPPADLLDLKAARGEVLSVHTFKRKQRPAGVQELA
jgi:hypothetical protein